MSRIVAYMPDLMDRSRLTAAGLDVRFVASTAELVAAAADGDADVAVVDLDRPGALDAVGRITIRTVGFGSHVERDRLVAARQAGCDEVLARSAFFARSGELLR